MQPDAERSNHSASHSDAAVRLTVQEAAAALGVTVEAIRGRMHRGKYKREKTEDGRVFVLLPRDQLTNVPPNDHERFDERSADRSRERSANGSDRDPEPGDDHALVQELVEELAEELRQEVKFLRAELVTRNEELRRREEEHREESRRKDHIIMSLTQRIPELEAPDRPRESPETVSEERGDGAVPPEAGGRERRPSWWRRLFGG